MSAGRGPMVSVMRTRCWCDPEDRGAGVVDVITRCFYYILLYCFLILSINRTKYYCLNMCVEVMNRDSPINIIFCLLHNLLTEFPRNKMK